MTIPGYLTTALADRYLIEREIEAKVHYPMPLHLQKPGRALGYKEGDFPVAETLAERIVSLPIYPQMTRQQVEQVAALAGEFLALPRSED